MAIIELVKAGREGGYTIFEVPEWSDEKEMALHVAKDRSVWLMDQELADRVINNGLVTYRCTYMGRTNYVIIYPKESIRVYDGMKYIIGEFMIMQDQKGLTCMSWEELREAVAEYNSRAVLLRVAGKCVAAYEIG
jgi:hypothetical protein